MKSAFGSKRKPRKIEVDEDDDLSQEPPNTQPYDAPSSTGRKAFKKSSLRQSITFDNDDGANSDGSAAQQIEQGPLGISRPSIGRSDSRKKKSQIKSRLSFGPGEVISGDAAEALEDDDLFTPKKPTLGRRVIETNAIRKNQSVNQIPPRTGENEDQRPIYSKDYLNQLKSSTPSTPKNLAGLAVTVDDEEELDETELEGAMIVDIPESLGLSVAVPTEAEIREKKDRRARLAKEQDFISLDDPGDNHRDIVLLPRKNKVESRLVREDEDLGEGFDEFVDDGRVSLGKKQEREAKRKQRKQMAEMIEAAEGSSSNDSDDSEKERQAAYEVAQTRAGMDGLSKPDTLAATRAPPKITPIPNLSECLQRLQTSLAGMEEELTRRSRKMEELQREKMEIVAREQEVQRLLKEAGDRYTAMKAEAGLPSAGPILLGDAQSGFAAPLMVSRGLESFGSTPVGSSNVEDVG